MSAMLGRIYGKGERIVAEYLALVPADAERGDSWRWTEQRFEAHWFDFATFEEEQKTIARFTERIGDRDVAPYAINGVSPVRRERDHEATIRETTVAAATAPERPVPKDGGERIKERIVKARAARKVRAQNRTDATKGTDAEKPAPRNTRDDGADRWQKVFRSRISPQESFDATERRCGS